MVCPAEPAVTAGHKSARPSAMQPHACRQAHRLRELAQADSVGRAVRSCDLPASVSYALGVTRSQSGMLPLMVCGRRECTHLASPTSHVGNLECLQMSGELWSDAWCEGYADAAIGPCSLHTPTARRRSCEKALQSACASHAAEHHGSVTCAIAPVQPHAPRRCKELPSTEVAEPLALQPVHTP